MLFEYSWETDCDCFYHLPTYMIFNHLFISHQFISHQFIRHLFISDLFISHQPSNRLCSVSDKTNPIPLSELPVNENKPSASSEPLLLHASESIHF